MLQCSSTHTVSSLCMYCSFPNTVQYSSTHTVSSLCMNYSFPNTVLYISTHTVSSLYIYCSFSNTVQYSSTPTVSFYCTVQHTHCHVTVQFNTHCIISLYVMFLSQHCTVLFSTHCIISLYVLFLSQHCTVQFNTHCIMLQYSSTHTLSCYSTVQHTLYHLSVHTVPFPTLYNTVRTPPTGLSNQFQLFQNSGR